MPLQIKKLVTLILFSKTLRIRNLRICSYGQILTVNLLIYCRISVIYGKMAVNYEEKVLWNRPLVDIFQYFFNFKNTK